MVENNKKRRAVNFTGKRNLVKNAHNNKEYITSCNFFKSSELSQRLIQTIDLTESLCQTCQVLFYYFITHCNTFSCYFNTFKCQFCYHFVNSIIFSIKVLLIKKQHNMNSTIIKLIYSSAKQLSAPCFY